MDRDVEKLLGEYWELFWFGISLGLGKNRSG